MVSGQRQADQAEPHPRRPHLRNGMKVPVRLPHPPWDSGVSASCVPGSPRPSGPSHLMHGLASSDAGYREGGACREMLGPAGVTGRTLPRCKGWPQGPVEVGARLQRAPCPSAPPGSSPPPCPLCFQGSSGPSHGLGRRPPPCVGPHGREPTHDGSRPSMLSNIKSVQNIK